ncbi:ubiquinone biosynthesis protein COQ9, mitochondrial [Diprion similis]|uniref:ubiquinone biosynthesis protein COQ9, mitochondrial n=1 Tax=Diprion similis TaxID=362088 RepID=UPI001EF92BC9|nr:ubiquinone biosynthesis protein COQ9, mitochondrial [Diprion similis]
MAPYSSILNISGLRRIVSVQSFRGIWTSYAVRADQEHNLAAQEPRSESSSNESDAEYENSIRSKILNAAIDFVPDLGWSKQAISAGAESVGYPGVIHGMFPNGGADLVQHFYSKCNKDLAEHLKFEALAIKDDSSKVRKPSVVYVKDAIETRLRMLIPYKNTWPQAMGLMALPPNVPTALANLLTLVDDICYHAGDRSVDFNWYARRIALAGIYKTTELYMLQDSSTDHHQTWKFLERRIEDAAQLHRVLSAAPGPPDLNQATEAVSAAFVTARNILGLNWNR